MSPGLLVTSSFLPGRGGIETYLAKLCDLLAPSLTVLAPPRRDGEPLLQDLDYPTFPFSRRIPLPDRRALEEIVETARQLGTDRVLFGTPWPLILLGPGLKRRGLRYASIVHGAELVAPSAVPILRTRLRRSLSEADLLLPVSDYTRRRTERFLRSSGRPVPPMELLRARIDLDRYRCEDDRSSLRAQIGLPSDGKMVLCFGRLVPRKGTHRVIEAMRLVRDRVPGATLVIAGTGPEMRRLKRLASADNDLVVFTGRVPDEDAAKVY
ncbi:MAG: phosphatidyl-myo-inositol dimannoside synthase, partial [Actinomycetota bacterium]|nr:phosphatidyl-myo-inositol dimannoside synthase [Actinomycetota bacterium]